MNFVPDNNAAVTAHNVTVAYGSRVIQSGLSFTVKKGDIFIIMGGSGCGKSSLLRVLMGLTPPAEGSVFYGKTDFWALPPPNAKPSCAAPASCSRAARSGLPAPSPKTSPSPSNITPASPPRDIRALASFKLHFVSCI